MTPYWLKFLPAPLRVRIEHRPNLQKALTNTGWLFGDKILRMGVGLLVGVWIARYLGPEQFGLLNYAMAIVAVFGAVASLGLNGIVVRDLVQEPDAAYTTLGTTLLLQFIGGLLAFCFAVIAIGFARPDDALAKMAVAVLGFVMVFKSTEVVKYWFESQVKSKYVVWVENGIFLTLAVVKVCLIISKAPLMAFVWTAFAEGLLMAVGLLGVYAWRGGILAKWRFRTRRACDLTKGGWLLMLAGLAMAGYTQSDQIMLGYMLGDEAVGVYTAALRISELWYFIPVAIVASVAPAIIEAKKTARTQYHRRLHNLHRLMMILAMIVAIPMTFLSDIAINLLFGKLFEGAGAVLAIHIWAGVFVFFGVASHQWFLVEGLQRYVLYRAAIGAIINIGLNATFIPIFGLIGAAWATIVAYAFSNIFLNVIWKETRGMFFMQMRGFLMRPYRDDCL